MEKKNLMNKLEGMTFEQIEKMNIPFKTPIEVTDLKGLKELSYFVRLNRNKNFKYTSNESVFVGTQVSESGDINKYGKYPISSIKEIKVLEN